MNILPSIGLFVLHALYIATLYRLWRLRVRENDPEYTYDPSYINESLTIWKLLPASPIAYIALIGIDAGKVRLGIDLFAGAIVWLSAWWFSRPKPGDMGGILLKLTALWLFGVAYAIEFDLSCSHSQHFVWLLDTAVTWGIALVAYWYLNRQSWRITDWLEGRQSVGFAIILVSVALVGSLIQLATHKPLPTYVAATLAFLFGGASIASQVAGWLSRPPTIKAWIARWARYLVVVGVVLAVQLLNANTAPILLICFTCVVGLFVLGESGRALQIATAIVAVVILLILGHVFSHLSERISEMSSPASGVNSQLIESQWGIARGGLFGRGPGMLLTHPIGQESAPAVPLSDTDGVFSATAEILGSTGVIEMLAGVLLIMGWFSQRSARPAFKANGVWFVFCGTLLWSTTLIAAAWPANILPIAGVEAINARGYGITTLAAIAILVSLRLASEDDAGSNNAGLPKAIRPNSVKLVRRTFYFATFWIVLAYIMMATTRREAILAQSFHNQLEEDRCQAAIKTGLVYLDHAGSIQINQRVALPRAYHIRHETDYDWALMAVSAHEFRTHTSPMPTLTVETSAFNQPEPSGLGVALAYAQRNSLQ